MWLKTFAKIIISVIRIFTMCVSGVAKLFYVFILLTTVSFRWHPSMINNEILILLALLHFILKGKFVDFTFENFSFLLYVPDGKAQGNPKNNVWMGGGYRSCWLWAIEV